MVKYLYRYYESCDEGGSPLIIRADYKVLKVTPKGFQIDAHRIKPRFVLDSGLKRFAHADKLEAKKAFIKRKKYHLRHLKNKVAFIELVLELEDDFMSSSDPIVSKPWDINNPFKLT